MLHSIIKFESLLEKLKMEDWFGWLSIYLVIFLLPEFLQFSFFLSQLYFCLPDKFSFWCYIITEFIDMCPTRKTKCERLSLFFSPVKSIYTFLSPTRRPKCQRNLYSYAIQYYKIWKSPRKIKMEDWLTVFIFFSSKINLYISVSNQMTGILERSIFLCYTVL